MDGTNKAPKSASEEDFDFISRMPENVITNILNRLPIQNAVGTSILSRNWRFKWTLLTQLIFDENFFVYLLIEEEEKDYDWRIIITRLVIHLQGPITKFLIDIDIPDNPVLNVENINHWVMLLSGKGIKDFTLINYHLNLPTNLFSCIELKHLKFRNCSFDTPPTFCGFPNLLSLELCEVTDYGNFNWGEFITKCPLLETLIFSDCEPPIGKVKLADIGKLINLKMLSLPLYMLDDLAITSSTIFQLGRYLPKLEKLTLDFEECKFIKEAVVRKWVCTAFPCLKNLTLSNIDLSSSIMLLCAFDIIWGSPNLQALQIRAVYNRVVAPPPAFYLPEVDNNTKLQLQSVVFLSFRGLENEEYLIKSLLACCTSLKNIDVHALSFPVLGGDNVKLPSHLFSCLELKHLKLDNCCLHPPPTFRGFPNLLSLDVSEVKDIGNCVEIIIKCPSLEILEIRSFVTIGGVKLAELAKLKNLTLLSLSLCMLENVTITSSTIFQLGRYLPKLKELNLNFQESKIIEEAGERKWVCTAFPCLKKLSLYNIDLSSSILLPFAFEMIWGSPNLQTLKITATNRVGVPPPPFSFPEVHNNTKLQLQSVVLSCFRGSKNEVYLIKTLLACSPLLHNMTIDAISSQVFGSDSGELMLTTKVLGFHRASPKAKVKLYCR